MLLKKFNTDSGVYIEPVFDTDYVLFSHCADGRLQVPLKEFTTSVKPLLRAHGITNPEVKDRTLHDSPITKHHRNRNLKS